MSLGFGKKQQFNNSLNRKTLPKIASSASVASAASVGSSVPGSNNLSRSTEFSLRQHGIDVHLSGLLDPTSTTSYASELQTPVRPVPICVRCSATHASICMSCCELVCENTLTFYRKTRAAGAATLFTKAFVEAGNSKLVKFFIFRLLRNGYEARVRKRQKIKSVVERLFGSNLVHEPFAAWRRFTKENIVERKERTITTLTEKIKELEMQINKLYAENVNQSDRIFTLEKQAEMTSVETKIHTSQISTLKDMLAKERKRVVGLCSLAEPLGGYTQLLQSVMEKEAAGVCQYLRNASTTVSSHNYAHIWKPTALLEVKKANKEWETAQSAPPPSVLDVLMPEDIAEAAAEGRDVEPPPSLSTTTTYKLMTEWLVGNSYNAGQHVDASSGRSLSLFLPTTEKLTEIADLKSGRYLLRVVVNLIMEFAKQSETARIVEASSVAQTAAQAKAVGAMKTTRSPHTISLEELQDIKVHEHDPPFLVRKALSLAHAAFRTPQYSADDILEGRVLNIVSFVVNLMTLSDPIVHGKEIGEINDHIHRYHELHSEQAAIQEEKDKVTHLSGITNLLESHISLQDHQRRQANKAVYPLLNHELLDKFTKDPREIALSLFPSVDHSYNHLVSAIDVFLDKGEPKQLSEVARLDSECSKRLFDLLTIAANSKEKRENGIRLTSEIKQFVLFNYFETIAPQMGMTYNKYTSS